MLKILFLSPTSQDLDVRHNLKTIGYVHAGGRGTERFTLTLVILLRSEGREVTRNFLILS